MKKIYIFGHKKPDTDSVASSIALSYLKNQLGFSTSPRVLGNVNNETKFILDYFAVKEPKYLNDVRLQIKDLNYLKSYHLYEKHSILQGLDYMNEHLISTLPIIDLNNKFKGIVSMKDIAKSQVADNISTICTSYNNIINALNGNKINQSNDEIVGNIIIASYRSTTFIDNVDLNHNTILIIGDRHSIIEHAIKNKVKLIILTGNSVIKEEHLLLAKVNNINIIQTEYDTFMSSRKIGLANYLSSIISKENVISFNEDEDVKDFITLANKSKYSNYPIINKFNDCLGILRLSDISDKEKKQVILVDHNEIAQSVDGIDEAEILEIIDHHKIATIDTILPINFRNMPVGSTNTIIYLLYKENNIDIPSNIAGLMLSGIISDTLMFKSPTTTNIDISTVITLAEIAKIDYEKYGLQMLKAGSSLKGKTKEEVIYGDFKNFTIDDKKIGVSQITTLNIDEIMKEKNEYINIINNIALNNNYEIVALFVTDIIRNGSYIFYNEKANDIIDNSFEIDNIYQGYYLDGIISRKKQIIPNIINILEKK